MRNCIRIPRLYLPRREFRKWAVPSSDSAAYDPFFWERVARQVGGDPSAFSLILPDAYLGDGEEERCKEIKDSIYRYLEENAIERLNRGFILVERSTKLGVRRGIMAAVDLEEFSPEGEKESIRSAEELDRALVMARYRVRRESVLEFPHAVLCYRDKKDKIMYALKREELEKLYEFDLMEGGGRIAGYFLPDYLSEEIVHELIRFADPCFGVLSGAHELTAAKAHWVALKSMMSAQEMRNHPARFALVEFVNLLDGAVELVPCHRVISEVEADVFADFFMRETGCKRSGNIFALPSGADAVRRADEAIARYIKANFGQVKYLAGDPASLSREGPVVALPPIDKEDFLSALKTGKQYPARSFVLSPLRYVLEGREISYD